MRQIETMDERLLEDVGLGALPPAAAHAALVEIYDTLTVRVGQRLLALLAGGEFAELDRLIDAGDEQGVCAWLEDHIPGRERIVREELSLLKKDVAARAEVLVLPAVENRPLDRS